MGHIMYDKMAAIFDQLANIKDHYNEQTEALIKIFHEININKESKILDAACGTAQVDLNLFRMGFKNISLTDGSQKVLEVAKSNLKDAMEVDIYLWEELDSYFNFNKDFDLIMIIGHSLPHSDISLLPKIMNNIYSGLKPKGKFLFDLRNWVLDEQNELTQPNRTINKERPLGNVKIDNVEYGLFDKVTYGDKKQFVEYLLKSKENFKVCDTFKLTYSIYKIDYLMEILIQVGFSNSGIKEIKNVNWPYLIYVAEK